jgi:hypothetical protein
VSRLFDVGVSRYADSVLVAAGDRDTCEADLELARVTALKGRGDATPPARRVPHSIGVARDSAIRDSTMRDSGSVIRDIRDE